jgi:hypothetical protein
MLWPGAADFGYPSARGNIMRWIMANQDLLFSFALLLSFSSLCLSGLPGARFTNFTKFLIKRILLTFYKRRYYKLFPLLAQ